MLHDELGCDPEQTYFDVPRMRTATQRDYLTTGIAYAFHPHRDTWYSAPLARSTGGCRSTRSRPRTHGVPPALLEPAGEERLARATTTTSGTAPAASTRRSTSRPTRASSRSPRSRWSSTRRSGSCRRPGGLILFSAAQMHSTVPNTSGRTRFSIDFRTVHLGDVRGAPRRSQRRLRVHGHDPCATISGCPDLSHVPEELCLSYDGAAPPLARARVPLLGSREPCPALRGRPSNAPTKRANHR